MSEFTDFDPYSVPMVENVTEDVMYGDTPLQKRLNAFITRHFIGSTDLPADECQTESRQLETEYIGKPMSDILEFLIHQFWGGPRDLDPEQLARFEVRAQDIYNILNEDI